MTRICFVCRSLKIVSLHRVLKVLIPEVTVHDVCHTWKQQNVIMKFVFVVKLKLLFLILLLLKLLFQHMNLWESLNLFFKIFFPVGSVLQHQESAKMLV